MGGGAVIDPVASVARPAVGGTIRHGFLPGPGRPHPPTAADPQGVVPGSNDPHM